MSLKTSTLTNNKLCRTRFRIQLPAEHGAVITFLLGLVLAIDLSADKLITSIISLCFSSIFCAYQNHQLRTVLSVSAVLFLSFCKLPLAIVTVVALHFGRSLMKSFSKIPLDLKQGAALTMLSLLPITAVVIEPGNTAIVLTKFTIFLHASILATASVFWFIKHRFSCLIFLAYAIGLMLLLFRIGATSLPEFLILDLLTGIIFILAKPALTLKRSGIINAIYLSLVTLRLI